MVALQSEITVLPGVGSVRAKALSMLEIYTVEDLLLHFPRAYQNRGDTKTIVEAAQSGEKCAMILTVGSEPRSVQLKNHKTLTTFTLFDDTGKVTSLWFNQTFVRQVFHVGSTFRFWGKVTRGNRGWEISSPEFEPVSKLHPLPDLTPIYPLTAGITQKFLQNLMGLALSSLDIAPEDVIPPAIRKKQGLCTRGEAFFKIHCPGDFKELAEARKYLNLLWALPVRNGNDADWLRRSLQLLQKCERNSEKISLLPSHQDRKKPLQMWNGIFNRGLPCAD